MLSNGGVEVHMHGLHVVSHGIIFLSNTFEKAFSIIQNYPYLHKNSIKNEVGQRLKIHVMRESVTKHITYKYNYHCVLSNLMLNTCNFSDPWCNVT